MRYIFSFLLLFVIFESVISAKSLKARMAVAAKALKMVSDRKRKLEATDVGTTDIEEGTASGNYTETGSDEKENGDAAANATQVNDNKPVSTQGTESDKKTAKVQIMKFHAFNTVRRQINFNVFFYFRLRAIARMVIFRLRISYFSRLRNLAEDSVPSYCKIKNEYESLVGTIPPEDNPANVDYDCNATALQDGTIANVTLNTDIDMQVSKVQDGKEVYESLNFTEVNFNGNSSQESQNLQQNTKVVSDTVSLKNTEAFERTTLKLTGEFDPSNKLSTGTTIPLTILTEKNGENTNIEYECTVKQTSPGELDCDTSSNPLKTTVQNLHLSAGTTSDNTLVTVYMKDSTNTTQITTTGGNRYSYNKSSSGLSGGAIAGIVIACVAVLLAASIAAIMLRKPAPPIDNTTVVGLKTVENI